MIEVAVASEGVTEASVVVSLVGSSLELSGMSRHRLHFLSFCDLLVHGQLRKVSNMKRDLLRRGQEEEGTKGSLRLSQRGHTSLSVMLHAPLYSFRRREEGNL